MQFLNISIFVYLFTLFHYMILLYFTLLSYLVGGGSISLINMANNLFISLSLLSPHIMFNYVVFNRNSFNIFVSKVHLSSVQHAWPIFLYAYLSLIIVVNFTTCPIGSYLGLISTLLYHTPSLCISFSEHIHMITSRQEEIPSISIS